MLTRHDVEASRQRTGCVGFEVVKMRCKRVQKLLVCYMDGELAEQIRGSVFEHLKGCRECSRYAKGVEDVLAYARAWGEREPSPYFLARLSARIRAGEEPAPRSRLLWLSRPRAVLAGLGGVCLVFLAGYMAGVGFSPEKRVSPRAEPRQNDDRLVVGIQRIKMVFGGKLSEAAYSQLNEAQRALVSRDAGGKEGIQIVEQLQRAESLIQEKRLAEAREVLDAIERRHADHPLAPYARMTKMFAAAPEEGYGSELLKSFYAMLLRDTVGDPRQFYVQLTSLPAQITEYGWQKIVQSADRLNPLNILDFIEQRLGAGRTSL